MNENKLKDYLMNEGSSAEINYSKKKSLEILDSVDDNLGSALAILSGLEGYIESLGLFYQENNDTKSTDIKNILKNVDKLKTNIDTLRNQTGLTHSIKNMVKKLKR